MKSRRSKATDITPAMRELILSRDKHCVVCGSHHTLTIAHVFVNRAHGGLAVKENLCVLCMKCHQRYDNGLYKYSSDIEFKVKYYMKKLYDIDVNKLRYRKWNNV